MASGMNDRPQMEVRIRFVSLPGAESQRRLAKVFDLLLQKGKSGEFSSGSEKSESGGDRKEMQK